MIRGFIDWECTAPQCVIDIPISNSNIMPLPSSVPIQFTGENRLVLKISLPLSLSLCLSIVTTLLPFGPLPVANFWVVFKPKVGQRVLLSKTRLDVIFFPLSIQQGQDVSA